MNNRSIFYRFAIASPIVGVLSFLYFQVAENPEFIDSKYAYADLDSCVSQANALRNKEEFASSFAKFYESGRLIFPEMTGISNYKPTPVVFNDKTDVIHYSDDNTYAKIRFKNPWQGENDNIYTDDFMVGYIPTNLLHDSPATKQKCD